MAHSIESRSPFLDYRLVEYVFSLGPEYKIRNALTKHLLRQSLRGILPEKVRLRRDKMGFTTPLAYWFRTILRDTIYGLLSSDRFLRRPYFNQEGVSSKLKDFLDGRKKNDAYTIWSWVNLELWFRKFIDESKPLQYSVG
jgi:asparagine synthase (glutamine-hydrolysing)